MDKDQREVFLQGEGDEWFNRNVITPSMLDEKSNKDPVVAAVDNLDNKPKHIIEIGASNGWRLEILRLRTGAICEGVEPSKLAVENGTENFHDISLYQGTAENLPFEDGSADLIILGFCLYLCDRKDLFRIAAECDRVLKDGGHIIVYDFYSDIPYRNRYKHKEGVYSYKMDYVSMFTWNPNYLCAEQRLTDHSGGMGSDPGDRLIIATLSKNAMTAYIDNPY